MLLSTVSISKNDKRVSVSEDVEAVKYRVNNGVSSSYVINRQ